MDVWMVARKDLKNDLLDIFSALDGLQYRYDWVISDHDMWYTASCPPEVKQRWQWTGLLMSGQELTEHLRQHYVCFCFGAVLSAVPLRTQKEQVCHYTPAWEVDLSAPDYQFQTPFTQLEIICDDGYAWAIVCPPELSESVRRSLPQAKLHDAFYEDLKNEERSHGDE